MMYFSDLELGNYLGNLDLISETFQASSPPDHHDATTFSYKLHTCPSGHKCLAFHSPTDYPTRFLQGDFDDLVSSHPALPDFISTNTTFSLNKAAVELFISLPQQLLNQFLPDHTNTPLVITGRGLGGYLAILSALWLHKAVDDEDDSLVKNTKRPVCITFGSPLLGDQALQRAILERPQWESCFLNVVATNDRVASYFSSESQYKPFGTYLFFTQSGGHTAFQDQDLVLAVLKAMRSSDGNMELCDYGNPLRSLTRNVLFQGVSPSTDINSDSFKAGITLQFGEINVLVPDNLIEKMEETQRKLTETKQKNLDPAKMLNTMKLSLVYLEWYIKLSRARARGGFYDDYKTSKDVAKLQPTLVHKAQLTQYWQKIVKENNRMPQKEGAQLRKRWLYGGTNYRRMVEPLDIAEHYRNSKTSYDEVRSDHYKLLEKWFNEDQKNSNGIEKKRNKAASFNEDSCFWAKVEDALIALQELRDGANKGDIKKRLEQFEAYLMLSIKNFSVSPDIFLEGSTLMRWWKEYEETCTDCLQSSDCANYMQQKSYFSYK